MIRDTERQSEKKRKKKGGAKWERIDGVAEKIGVSL